MPFVDDIYVQFGAATISKLTEKGYLSTPLDWDFEANSKKYTLRIRAGDGRPMIAVGLISFRKKDNLIILTNAVTGNKAEFKLVVDKEGNSNLKEFLTFVCDFAQKLREEAAYK